MQKPAVGTWIAKEISRKKINHRSFEICEMELHSCSVLSRPRMPAYWPIFLLAPAKAKQTWKDKTKTFVTSFTHVLKWELYSATYGARRYFSRFNIRFFSSVVSWARRTTELLSLNSCTSKRFLPRKPTSSYLETKSKIRSNRKSQSRDKKKCFADLKKWKSDN